MHVSLYSPQWRAQGEYRLVYVITFPPCRAVLPRGGLRKSRAHDVGGSVEIARGTRVSNSDTRDESVEFQTRVFRQESSRAPRQSRFQVAVVSASPLLEGGCAFPIVSNVALSEGLPLTIPRESSRGNGFVASCVPESHDSCVTKVDDTGFMIEHLRLPQPGP